MRAWIHSVGVQGPGLTGWEAAEQTLRNRDAVPFSGTAMPVPALEFLPANERRRLTGHLRLALSTAADTCRVLDLPQAEAMPTVFASAEGDLAIVDRLCQALTLPGKPVSPTQFHNSVHNTAAAYWHQAMGWHSASTSISVAEGGFAGALLEALVQLADGRPELAEGSTTDRAIDQTADVAADRGSRCVLLIVSDQVAPARLGEVCLYTAPFGCGLILGRDPPIAGGWHLEVQRGDGPAVDRLADPHLETLRNACPSAAALPLLAALARRKTAEIRLPWLPDLALGVRITLGRGGAA